MMGERKKRSLTNDADTWWTIDQAAEHFGYRRETILKWIREGYVVPYGKARMLHRPDVLAEHRRRMRNTIATRATRVIPGE